MDLENMFSSEIDKDWRAFMMCMMSHEGNVGEIREKSRTTTL
jgi:L-rhamnose mutarotase